MNRTLSFVGPTGLEPLVTENTTREIPNDSPCHTIDNTQGENPNFVDQTESLPPPPLAPVSTPSTVENNHDHGVSFGAAHFLDYSVDLMASSRENEQEAHGPSGGNDGEHPFHDPPPLLPPEFMRSVFGNNSQSAPDNFAILRPLFWSLCARLKMNFEGRFLP